MTDFISIPGTNYSISKCGRVRNEKFDREVKPFDNGNGYLAVDLYTKGASRVVGLHRILMEVFVPNPENKSHVNHKDGNPMNNDLDNLEWCSPSENHRHRYHVLKSTAIRCDVSGKFIKKEFPE